VVLFEEWRDALGESRISAATALDITKAPGFIRNTGKNWARPGDDIVFGAINGNVDGITAATGHIGIVVKNLGHGLVKVINANYGRGSNEGAGLSPSYSILHYSDAEGWLPEHLKKGSSRLKINPRNPKETAASWFGDHWGWIAVGGGVGLILIESARR
jgi:hypothetical protein